MLNRVITPDLRWKQWIIVIVLLLVVVYAVSSITSSAAEVLIGSTLGAITIGLMFGCVRYLGRREAEGWS